MANKEKNCRLGKVGGQAVLEGVMMRSGDEVSLAVRQQDGTIVVKNSKFVSVRKKNKLLNIPLLRGCINMVEMLKLSFGTLEDSANMLGLDDFEEETKFDKWLRKVCGDKMMDVIMGIAMVIGVVLSVALFVFLPNLATMGVNALYHNAVGENMPSLLQNLISGVIRIVIFVGYMLLCSLMKDVRRTFEYHGAEHKSVACYEAGMELTVENAKKCSRLHPRCGTSFIFIMLILSIIVTSFINWNTWPKWAIMLTKLGMLPVIVGIGFEFLMIAGKYPNPVTKLLSVPGLWMQRITTKEPDDSQIEVAIKAIKCAMPDEFPDERENSNIYKEEKEKEAEGEAEGDSSKAE